MFLSWLKKKPQPMQPMHIIENIVPGLIDQLQKASSDQRLRLLPKVFELACRSIKTIEPELQSLLDEYRRTQALSETQVLRARAFAESADEKYSELEERDSNSKDCGHWFANARLATALAEASGGGAWTNAADAIYELSVIPDDSTALFQLVKSELAKMRAS